MTTKADGPIAALRSGHDTLAAHIEKVGAAGWTGPSGASEWTVAQVLSHLGSGAEINLASLSGAADGTGAPPEGFNQSVWDRWDAMSPVEQVEGFLRADAELVARYEALDADARENLRIELGFLPDPVDVAFCAALRLSELTHHSWDVRVAADPGAQLAPEAVPFLLDQLGVFLGYFAQAKEVEGAPAVAVRLSEPEREFGLVIGEAAALGDAPAEPDATLTAPAEAWLRLTAGRLTPAHTPAGVAATGAVSLDDLRRVFPGY